MPIYLIDKIKPKNNGEFPIVDADDVLMPDGKRLSALNLSMGGGENGTIPHIGEDGNWWVGDTNTGVKAQGESGGYYRPSVTDNGDGTFTMSFTPSINGMPIPAPVVVTIPTGEDGMTPHIGVNGNWWIGQTDTGVSASGSGGGGGSATQRKYILEETRYDGFEFSDAYGVYAYGFNPCPFALVIGETYTVEWDGVSYTCTAVDASAFMPGFVALGNFSALTGGESTGEPFILGYAEVGVSGQPEINFIAFDTQTEHTVAIYQENAIATENFVRTYVEQYISEALGGDY